MDATGPIAAEPVHRATAVRRLESLGRANVLVLLLQVVVGIANTLWLDIPDSGNAWLVSSPMVLLTAHLSLAFIVTVLSVWLLLQAARSRNRLWLAAGTIGLLGTLAALLGGFVSMSLNGAATPSFVMATGCVVSIAAYAIALAKRHRPGTP